MKKGWKIFWITIAVIVMLGISFCVIALCMGVSFRSLRRDYSGSRLARLIDRWDGDWDDLDDALDDLDDLGDQWDDPDDRHHGSGEATVLSEYDYEGITELEMSVGKCKVNIRPAAQDYIHIDTSDLYFSDYNMELQVEQKGSTLSIETLKDGVVWDVIGGIINRETNGLAGTLNIYLPQDLHLTRASLSFGGCDVEIKGMTADDVTLKSGAADCELENVTFGALDVEVGAGDLDLKGTVGGDITAKCGAGDLELKLTGKETDYNYSLKCGAGEVELNDRDYGGLAKVKRIDNNSDKTIDIACGAGDVTIEFTNR